MNRILALSAATALSLALTACNQTPTSAAPAASNHDADLQAIRDNETQWNKDFAAKDAAKVAAHYADDAVLMTPGRPAAAGKDAIQKEYQSVIADPAFSLQFQTAQTEVAGSGDLAYTRGMYTLTMTDPQTKKVMNDHGSFLTNYRKQADGSWKAVEDVATSEVPMMPAPPVNKKH